LARAICPICGRHYTVPEGRGREMVITKFLAHKDNCELPKEDEFVRIDGRVGVVLECNDGKGQYPSYEVQMPSGRTSVFPASKVERLSDQDEGKRRFFA
jgi:hypothetical protein